MTDDFDDILIKFLFLIIGLGIGFCFGAVAFLK